MIKRLSKYNRICSEWLSQRPQDKLKTFFFNKCANVYFCVLEAKLEEFATEDYYYFVDRRTHGWTHGQTGCFEYTPENIRFAGVMINRRDAAQHKRQRSNGIAKPPQSSQAWYLKNSKPVVGLKT